MKYTIPTLSLALMALLGLSSQVQAAPCLTSDAIANGLPADACAATGTNPGNPTGEASYINGLGWGDPFTYIGKAQNGGSYDGAGTPAGWSLNNATPAYSNYMFGFTVTGPVGTPIDFVLGVKQASGSYKAYRFDSRTLTINGAFNNIYLNNGQNEVNDFSHMSGFFRDSVDGIPLKPIPEPSAIALLGIGLLGLGLSRRRVRS